MSKKPVESTTASTEFPSSHRSPPQTDSLPSTSSPPNGSLSMTEVKTSGKARILTVGQKLPPVTMQKVEAGEGVDMIGMGADAHLSAQAALAAGLGDRLSTTKQMATESSQEGDSLAMTHVLPKPAGGPSRVEVSMSNLQVSGSVSQTVVFLPGEPEPLPAVWNIPFLEDRYFVGRKSIEAQLARSFLPLAERKEKMSAAQAVVLTAHGLGGVGKTFVALHYAWHTTQPYTFRAWFSAETKEGLIRDYRDFCRIYHIHLSEKSSDEEVIGAMKGWLGSHPGWLLIYDNAPDYEAVRAYLPASGGDILLTSRSTRLWPGEQIRVDILSEDEAIELVKRRMRPNNFKAKLSEAEEAALRALIKELGYLPLALAQAAAYMTECKTSVTEYLALYRELTDELLDEHKLRSDEYPESVAKTWLITMKRIREELPLAAEVFNGCAYLAPDVIPKAIITHLVKSLMIEKESKEPAEAKMSLMTNQVLGCLCGYSMAAPMEQNAISIHRLVQQVTRLGLQKQAEQKESDPQKIVTKTLLSLRNSCPQGDQDMQTIQHRRQWITHLETALQHYEQHQWSYTLDIISVMEMLGNIYVNDRSESQRGQKYGEKVLEFSEHYFGDHSREVATALTDLGWMYKDDKPIKALSLLKRAKGIHEQFLGCRDPGVLETWVNLASVYASTGQLREGRTLLLEVLTMTAYQQRPMIKRLPILIGLGNIHLSLNEVQEGKNLLAQVVSIAEHHYGPNHIQVANILVNLGNAYALIGSYSEAQVLLERTLKIQEKHYGEESIEVVLTLMNLGNVYGRSGRFELKCKMLERALTIQEKNFGANHFMVGKTLTDLANIYLDDNPKKAQELLTRALPIQREHYGPDHQEISIILLSLGLAYRSFDRQKSLEYLQKAKIIQEKCNSKDQRAMGKILTNLGECYSALHEPYKAWESLYQALIMKADYYGWDHIEITTTLINLGNACRMLGDRRQHCKLLERALIIQKKHYGPDHFEVANTLSLLAAAYMVLKKYKEAKALLEEAVPILEKRWGPDHFRVKIAIKGLELVYQHLEAPSAIPDTPMDEKLQQPCQTELNILFENQFKPLRAACEQAGSCLQKLHALATLPNNDISSVQIKIEVQQQKILLDDLLMKLTYLLEFIPDGIGVEQRNMADRVMNQILKLQETANYLIQNVMNMKSIDVELADVLDDLDILNNVFLEEAKIDKSPAVMAEFKQKQEKIAADLKQGQTLQKRCNETKSDRAVQEELIGFIQKARLLLQEVDADLNIETVPEGKEVKQTLTLDKFVIGGRLREAISYLENVYAGLLAEEQKDIAVQVKDLWDEGIALQKRLFSSLSPTLVEEITQFEQAIEELRTLIVEVMEAQEEETVVDFHDVHHVDQPPTTEGMSMLQERRSGSQVQVEEKEDAVSLSLPKNGMQPSSAAITTAGPTSILRKKYWDNPMRVMPVPRSSASVSNPQVTAVTTSTAPVPRKPGDPSL